MMFAATGCTRDNPAFDGSSDTGESATSDGESTTLTSAEADSDGGQESTEPVCELQGGVQLEIDLGPAGCADPPDVYDRLHPVVMVEGSTLWVGTCQPDAVDCSQCVSDVLTPLSFAPLDAATIAGADTCLRVLARRVDPNNPDVCRFQSVVIQSADPGVTPSVLMVGRNAPGVELPALDNSHPLANFAPTPDFVDDCPCSEYPSSCCDGVAPTVYALDVGLEQPVPIGDTALLEYPQQTYEFHTLDAFVSGECDQGLRESWALIAS